MASAIELLRIVNECQSERRRLIRAGLKDSPEYVANDEREDAALAEMEVE